MYWNRFDIVEAYYSFLSDYHCGQWDSKYSRLCKVLRYFKPSRSFYGYRSLTLNGKAIYDNLVRRESGK